MGTLKKANMLFLTKEATNEDQKLKMEMLMSTTDDKKNSEAIWNKNGFFSDQKEEFTISKNNFPGNTSVYCNQGTISTVKSGENAIYLDYAVLGQIIPVRNCPPDIENYECGRNEVKLIMPDYDTTNGHFKGVKKCLGYIMVRGDEDELFLSYGYNEEKSMVPFSSSKQALPNIFQGSSFKKTIKCYLMVMMIFRNYFFICQALQIERRKLTNLERMFSFLRLIVFMIIL